ncbi:MAG: Ubiquinone/menaquinone biosynthesis C-methyltransferase UbiE [Methanonatronarchaeales archaeon]|nr:Ubiquinone/menaquinone biosynthesis C-methyltransferase UbiE [Methanonatronarchaeales archaeon]
MRGRAWYQEEEVAESYEDERFGSRGGALINRRETEVLLSLLGDVEGTRVLEVATGTGRFAETMEREGADVVGLDVSMEMMEQGFERCGGLFVRGDGSRLPFREDRFDVVVAMRFLHLIPDPRPFVEEMKRVSRSSVVFDTFNSRSGRILYNRFLPMGSRLYGEEDVTELLREAGLGRVRRRDEFLFPFGGYRFAPDLLADAMETVDEALVSTGPGRALSSVTYWKASVK